MKDRWISIAAFAILAGLWLIFAAALVFNPDLLTAAWQTLHGWPLVVQGLVWLLALPVTLGLWIWQMPWPVLLRLVLVAGLAWATVYTFFPWKNRTKSAAAAA
jgi:hypothetical protein